MQYAKECLYDVEWQVLRVSLLGHSGTSNWQAALLAYQTIDYGSDDWMERKWRVVNLCNATLLAYGNREGLEAEREIVKNVRAQAQAGMSTVAGVWDWNKVRDDLETLHAMNRRAFVAVRENLQGRVKMSQYKARKRGEVDNKDGFKHRSELELFLSYMTEVADGNSST